MFSNDLSILANRKARAEAGLNNCLPLPFSEARKKFPGFERGSYAVFSANQKVGKTKLVDYLFVYESIKAIIHGKRVKPHILYFSLEETTLAKRLSLYEHLFYIIDGIIVDNKILKSTDQDYPCPQWVLDKLESEEYQKYINTYFDIVEFPVDEKTSQSISNADDIYNICRQYAEANGKYNTYKKKVYDHMYRAYVEKDAIDETNPFTWNDDELLPIIIIDNFANLSVPKGSTKYLEIEKMSKLCVILKNLGFLVVAVQHQSQEKESLTRRQADDVIPSAEGLADNKSTSKDLTLLVGLMSPFKYEMPVFMGYDITKWRDNIRFFFIKEDRENGAINLCQPLLFIGESSVFEELPSYKETQKLDEIYNHLKKKKEDYECNFHNKEKEKPTLNFLSLIKSVFKKNTHTFFKTNNGSD